MTVQDEKIKKQEQKEKKERAARLRAKEDAAAEQMKFQKKQDKIKASATRKQEVLGSIELIALALILAPSSTLILRHTLTVTLGISKSQIERSRAFEKSGKEEEERRIVEREAAREMGDWHAGRAGWGAKEKSPASCNQDKQGKARDARGIKPAQEKTGWINNNSQITIDHNSAYFKTGTERSRREI